MAAMTFWGVEAKAKEPFKVDVEEGRVIHLSQATLGELKKDNEPVIIHVKVADKKFVLGLLNQTTPQLSFDLVFDQEFEISHNLKNGSVHFLGYSTEMPDEIDDDMFEDDSDEEALPVLPKENGKPAASAQVQAAKPKADVKPAKDDKPKQQEKDDSDDSDDDEDDSDEDDDSSDEDMLGQSDGSDDDDEDEDDEEEDEKPAKPQSGKKRANADAKTPEPKKAKLVTPQKTDGKKGAHTATPHPSKKGGKTPGSGTPKSGGEFSCGPCKKSFNSDNALQSHNKAKHAAK